MHYPKSKNMRRWWLFQDNLVIAEGILFSSGAGEVLASADTDAPLPLTTFDDVTELYIAFPHATTFLQAL